ncbi:hypothetical protein G4G28_11110 [Massilia sp. Dwa41.01b]|uniref:hypothetical protein n=1 Tax=unclassified Massilia TaxID=2609279 RepID=UPI0015FFFD7D|nr:MULTISPECIES: hypothetical protein [unclassified Massilia]QNA88898.1 hypothetical protein G4G28_11110 [Massilia sp. Dwa41.01b]QNA99789.1 hypothetical protein G4G31_14740 [Massilia sp. Se16.2.3]
MWIVAIGWGYVVILMAATESSIIAGIMTFFGYGVLPLSILFYLTGGARRRARHEMAARQQLAAEAGDTAPAAAETGPQAPGNTAN